jgi:hypothetical protein
MVNKKRFRWCGKCVRWTTAHDTVGHQKGTKAKTEANVELVESATAWDIVDTSAWHVGISNTFFLQDVWDVFGPCIKLLQFGLLFHFSPVFLDFIVTILLATGMAMWNQGWSVVAPILWLVGLIVTLWMGLLPFQDDNPEPCWKRRNQKQDAKRQCKARCGWDPGSIRSHRFHR